MSGITKPLRCKLRLHSWFMDSAMFSSCLICNYCGKAESKRDHERLALERRLWSEPGATFETVMKGMLNGGR